MWFMGSKMPRGSYRIDLHFAVSSPRLSAGLQSEPGRGDKPGHRRRGSDGFFVPRGPCEVWIPREMILSQLKAQLFCVSRLARKSSSNWNKCVRLAALHDPYSSAAKRMACSERSMETAWLVGCEDRGIMQSVRSQELANGMSSAAECA